MPEDVTGVVAEVGVKPPAPGEPHKTIEDGKEVTSDSAAVNPLYTPSDASQNPMEGISVPAKSYKDYPETYVVAHHLVGNQTMGEVFDIAQFREVNSKEALQRLFDLQAIRLADVPDLIRIYGE